MIVYLHNFQLTANHDRWIGFVSSVSIHALLLFVGGALFVTGVEYGVEYGSGGIEVNLVAALPQEDTETAVAIPYEIEERLELKEAVFMKEPNTTTLQSSGGALVDVKPGYLRNPAPRYPEEARRAGHEGLVILLVRVDRGGFPSSTEIQESSGHPLLDESAAKAVKRWRFYPAKIGSLPVESKVEVPIRFRLE